MRGTAESQVLEPRPPPPVPLPGGLSRAQTDSPQGLGGGDRTGDVSHPLMPELRLTTFLLLLLTKGDPASQGFPVHQTSAAPSSRLRRQRLTCNPFETPVRSQGSGLRCPWPRGIHPLVYCSPRCRPVRPSHAVPSGVTTAPPPPSQSPLTVQLTACCRLQHTPPSHLRTLPCPVIARSTGHL
ncbi:unnamed protein product [Rangifer tarandus platyrhynchus]|uniref:Uncharacterized protein n=1 Tax=Rangifer tarandus platyrhynchus TaxID=3082113 RepID=A0AC59YN45_RANTA